MSNTIKVLIGDSDPTLHEQARSLSPRIEIVTAQQVREHPEIIPELEIVYGGLRREQIGQAAKLRWLQTAGAGVNSLITPEMRDSDLIVTNASGIHAEPITEHMFGMLLVVTRRLREAWEQQKTRRWRGYDFGAHVDMLAGKTLGVLGVGAIGGHSAQVGKAFGMRVLGLRRTGGTHPHVDKMYTPDERLDFLRESDVVMNSLPLTDKTRGFIGAAELAAMKPTAILINTGRGGTIDTEALLAALREKRLGAALLDVTDPEPLPEDHPLWTFDNVYITPHYSGGHLAYSRRANRIFLENLRRYVHGEPLVNVVDKREGY